MGFFGLGRRRAEEERAATLSEDLFAGGERTDRAIGFLSERIAQKSRTGSDEAVQEFAQWMDVLMEGDAEAAAV